jgi:allantoinase
MTDFDLVVRGRIVLADDTIEEGYLAIANGRISRIGRDAPPSAKDLMDCRGQWIMPGVVDGQVHTGSQRDKEGLGRGSQAAAAGGVTTIVDMPYDDPEPVFDANILNRKIQHVERESHVDVALYGTIRPDKGLDAIPALVEAGVCAFKFSTFEASRTRFPRISDDTLMEAFSLIRPSGLACGVHNQDQELTDKNIKAAIATGNVDWAAWGRANCALVENLATARIYEIGAQTGARAHVVHCSQPRGFELCKMYKRAGHSASIETCVQYLMLNEEEHMRRFGAKTKIYPPIRPRRTVEALWTYIASGDCDFVSSDHVSWGLERKQNPNIFENASGAPGLETLLPAFWTGCEQRGLSCSTVATLLSSGPAKHFLIDGQKGSLRVGSDADIVVLEPGRFVHDPARSLSAASWSPFEGQVFTVRVAATLVRGALVWDGTRISNEAGFGQFVRPPKAEWVRRANVAAQ